VADAATIEHLEARALEMRKRLLRLANRTSLHIGGDLSMTELMTVVFEYLMNVDPERPEWPDRDRFILSKGHGAGALYISMANRGFFDVEEIYETYGALGSRFGMHPCRNHLPGVEMSTGSLGHGLSLSVGLALAARLDGRMNRVVTLMGDGELNEGSVWEAAMAAAQFRLGSIIAFVDKNDMCMDGAQDDVMQVNPVDQKFAAFGWNVVTVDGHDLVALADAIDDLPPSSSDRPTVVVAQTVKGRGIGFMENTTKWHSGQIDDATLEACYVELDERYAQQQDERYAKQQEVSS
jgi:transketolase